MASKVKKAVKKVVRRRFLRELRWSTSSGMAHFGVSAPGYGYDSRYLQGEVGKALSNFSLRGKLTYSRAVPGTDTPRLMVARAPYGVIIGFFKRFESAPSATEYLGMCTPFRRHLGFATAGQVRWYTVEVVV